MIQPTNQTAHTKFPQTKAFPLDMPFKKASAPDHAQTIGGDPLILLADQTLLSPDAEQTIEALLERFQFG